MGLDAGMLDRRAILETNEPVADTLGGARDAWREVGDVSVRLEPLSVAVRERFEQREGKLTHRVILRHRQGVERGMAFRFGQRRMLIRSVHDPDETRRFLVCRCEEEA